MLLTKSRKSPATSNSWKEILKFFKMLRKSVQILTSSGAHKVNRSTTFLLFVRGASEIIRYKSFLLIKKITCTLH